MCIRSLVLAISFVAAATIGLSDAAAKSKSAVAPVRRPAKKEVEKPVEKSVEKAPIKINENPLTVRGEIQPSNVQAGGTTQLILHLELDPNYHGYKDKFDLKLIGGGSLSPFELTPIVSFYDKLAKVDKQGIHERADMKSTITLPSTLPLGAQTLALELKYQACADDHCLFPKKLKIAVPMTIVASASSQPPAATIAAAPKATSSGAFNVGQELERNPLKAFLFVFGFGILTSLTPCIFPMIPITLSIIGARTVGKQDPNAPKFSMKGFVLSIFYVLGIALTYALLGVTAAMTGSMFGAMLGNPWVVTGIAMLFVVMGLSMYGLFEIQAPAFIRDRLGNKNTGTGYLGAFSSGLIAGIVVGPCVGPVLVTILTYVAKTKDPALGFLLLFTYAIGMGMLFIVLGTFSSLLSALPRSGGWMDVVKFVFGTSMIGLALYYINPVIDDKRVFYALVAIAAIMIASAYGAFDSNEGLSIKGKLRKGAMVMLLIIGFGFGLRAIFSEVLTGGGMATALAPATGAASSTGEATTANASTPAAKTLAWKSYSDTDFRASLGRGKAVVLDFWADWCAACKELEHYTYSDPQVQSESSNLVLFSYDSTSESEELTKLKQQYGVMGLPTLLFFSPSGELREDLTLTGFEGPQEFTKRLRLAQEDQRKPAEDPATASTK